MSESAGAPEADAGAVDRSGGPVVAAGAGRMGRGIALAYALAGREVAVLDLRERTAEAVAELSAAVTAELTATLDDLIALGRLDRARAEAVLGRVRVIDRDGAAELLAEARLVFEGVPETRQAKAEALGLISELAGDSTVIASTTSTMLVTELAPLVRHPERFLNAHWLNPAFVIPLVELSVHDETQEWVLASVREDLARIGKQTVTCSASPGFIVPRLQALVMNEAARMVEEGVASVEDIDRATRHGLGFRFAALGVLEFIDFGGNDILVHASRYLGEQVSSERYELPEIVEQNMTGGRNGLRDLQGFYDYDPSTVPAYRRDVLARTLGMLDHFER